MPSILKSIEIFDHAELEDPTPVDNSSNASSILAINGVFCFLSLIVVLGRLYVRGFMLGSIGADDCLIIAAMICGIGVFVCFIGETVSNFEERFIYLFWTNHMSHSSFHCLWNPQASILSWLIITDSENFQQHGIGMHMAAIPRTEMMKQMHWQFVCKDFQTPPLFLLELKTAFLT